MNSLERLRARRWGKGMVQIGEIGGYRQESKEVDTEQLSLAPIIGRGQIQLAALSPQALIRCAHIDITA